MATNQQSPSTKLTQAQLLQLGYDVADRFDKVIKLFRLDLSDEGNAYVGPCPVHGGDSPNAFNLYKEGRNNRGNWACYTHHCEKEFTNSPIGLIRGLLSHKYNQWEFRGDKRVHFSEAINWCLNFTKRTENELDFDAEDLDERCFIAATQKTQNKTVVGPKREEVLKSGLIIPAPYYRDKYNEEILGRYDVGLCKNPSKFFYERSVVPVYDEGRAVMVGATGRSIYDECELCHSYHNPAKPCRNVAKWLHSKGFKTENSLYNYWFAKDKIKKSGTVILVESPGNVWKLEEAGIHNSLAVFGSALKEGQRRILDKSGALCILVIGDKDHGGETLIADVKKQCSDLYNVIGIMPETGDLSDLSIDGVKSLVLPSLSRLNIYGAYLNS